MIRVEKIKVSELEQLSKLYYQLINNESSVEKMIRSFENIDKSPNYYLLGIKDEDKLIGSAMAIVCYDLIRDCRPFMVIENVIIDENYRGKGYGRILLNKAEDIARENNCYYIMLLSNKKRVKSHKFYIDNGYNCDNIGFKKYL